MMATAPDLAARLAALRNRLNARAAGAWRVLGDRLEEFAFVPAPDLPKAIAEGFAEATRSVPRDQVDLAIARAAATGCVVVSIADELPADRGSGHWLRLFGAARSVAVPLSGPGGSLTFVVSVALGLVPPADVVERAIREAIFPAEG